MTMDQAVPIVVSTSSSSLLGGAGVADVASSSGNTAALQAGAADAPTDLPQLPLDVKPPSRLPSISSLLMTTPTTTSVAGGIIDTSSLFTPSNLIPMTTSLAVPPSLAPNVNTSVSAAPVILSAAAPTITIGGNVDPKTPTTATAVLGFSLVGTPTPVSRADAAYVDIYRDLVATEPSFAGLTASSALMPATNTTTTMLPPPPSGADRRERHAGRTSNSPPASPPHVPQRSPPQLRRSTRAASLQRPQYSVMDGEDGDDVDVDMEDDVASTASTRKRSKAQQPPHQPRQRRRHVDDEGDDEDFDNDDADADFKPDDASDATLTDDEQPQQPRRAGMAPSSSSSQPAGLSSCRIRRQVVKAKRPRPTDELLAGLDDDLYDADVAREVHISPEEEEDLLAQLRQKQRELEECPRHMQGLTAVEKKRLRNRHASCVSRLKKKIFVGRMQRRWEAAAQLLRNTRNQLERARVELAEARIKLQMRGMA